MKALINIKYGRCDLFDKLIVFRIVHEIFITNKNDSLLLTTDGLDKNIKIELTYSLDDYLFISFALRKLKELKELVSSELRIKINHENDNSSISIDYVQKVVCEYFHTSIESIQNTTRKHEVLRPRQISMYFAKNLTKSSLATIGSHIGGKDHATVLHACKTVNNLIDTEISFRAQINEIERRIKA